MNILRNGSKLQDLTNNKLWYHESSPYNILRLCVCYIIHLNCGFVIICWHFYFILQAWHCLIFYLVCVKNSIYADRVTDKEENRNILTNNYLLCRGIFEHLLKLIQGQFQYFYYLITTFESSFVSIISAFWIITGQLTILL